MAALGERRRDTFEAHERGLSGRLSAGCCSRGQEDETEPRTDGRRWRRGGARSAKAERNGTTAPTKTSGFKPGANNQRGAVTESIIYFRTLDSSLRFLGR